MITSSSARAPDALRNKNDCRRNRKREQETSWAALYSPCRHHNRDKEDRGVQEGLGTNRPRGEEEMEQKEETGH